MPHKADASFFDAKRPWSKRKDLILQTYLKPYLAKVSSIGRPIVVVDAFAGAGRYKSGEIGSPLIAATAITEALGWNKVPISLVCIEQDTTLYPRLVEALAPFSFARARKGTFLEAIEEINQLAGNFTTFLYVDPYAIEGLEWEPMAKIFEKLKGGQSIEILLNFSASSFVRRALAALSMAVPDDEDGGEALEVPTINRLNAAVGGGWWREILERGGTFATQVDAVAAGYCNQLRQHFREVCEHPIRAKWDDEIPKYSLIFASRSPDALLLMNDATIKSRDVLAEEAKPAYLTLFDDRPLQLAPDIRDLRQLVLNSIVQRTTRKRVAIEIIREAFCRYTQKQIYDEVRELLKLRVLTSSTGKAMINDGAEIWKS